MVPLFSPDLEDIVRHQVSAVLADSLISYSQINSPVPEPRTATLRQASTSPFKQVSAVVDNHPSLQNRGRRYENRTSCFYCGISGHVTKNGHRHCRDQDARRDRSFPQRYEPREYQYSRSDRPSPQRFEPRECQLRRDLG